MNIQKFADEVTREEGLRKSVNKGQVLEVLRIANAKLNGQLYDDIRRLPNKAIASESGK